MHSHETGDVVQNGGCGTCDTAVGGGTHRAAPAALVEGVSLNSMGGKVREEGVIGVAVVTEAMNED